MNGGTVIAVRQNKYIRSFRRAGADAPQSARTLEDLHLRDSWIFRRMVGRGIFVPADQDRWYISESAAENFLRARRTIVLSFVVVSLAILVIALIVLRSS